MKTRILNFVIGIAVIIILILVLVIYYCLSGQPLNYENEGIIQGDNDTNSLVVYFTRAKAINHDDNVNSDSHASVQVENNQIEGNTEIMAKMIQEKTGSDLYAITVDKSYRSPFLATSLRAWVEKQFNMHPELTNLPDDIDKYDVIYIGFPIWWYQEPMAVDTFLESYNFDSKTIIPFCTSTSSSIEQSMTSIQNICPQATVLEGLRLQQANETEIDQWLQNINPGN